MSFDTIRFKLLNLSDYSDLAFNLVLNFVLFEFSIPKYIYGHNLLQYPLSDGNEHDDLKTFIERFFLHEFKAPVKFSDIEIQRLDICFNYEFQTIENKEQYK